MAKKYSCADNYVEITTNAIKEMLRQTGKPEFDSQGIMRKGTIIRHLLLPNHVKNSIGVIDILRDNFKDYLLSLMGQYIPFGKAVEMEKLNRTVTKREYKKVEDYVIECGIDGFTQELSSADTKYIPIWDYK